jgi:hypothetical protein
MKKDVIAELCLVAVAFVLIAAVLVLFIAVDIASLKSNTDLQNFLPVLQSGLPYFLTALALLATATILKISLKGIFTKPLTRTLNIFALAILLYFLLTSQYASIQYQTLSIYLLLTIAVIAVYTLFNPLLKSYKQFTLRTILKFLTLITLGIVLQLATIAYNQDQQVANTITIGFVFGGLTTIAAPLENGKRTKTRKIGKFFGKATITFIVLGIILGVYIYYLRPQLVELNSNVVMIGEWVTIGLLVLGSLLSIRSKVGPVTAPMLLESWQKHQQDLNFRTTDEFLVFSQAIDAFITSARKNDLLLLLYKFLSENKITIVNTDYLLDELINYHDQPPPRIFFSWDETFLEQEALEERKNIVKKLIKKLNPDLFRNNLELTSK